MPAELVPNDAIPKLAAQVDSPAMLRVLRHLQHAGFISNGHDIDPPTLSVLQRLSELGLVDPGYSGPTNGQPFVWVSNHNGERVLRHLETTAPQSPLESRLQIQPRAGTALATLSEGQQLAVLTAAEALQGRDPASWPREAVTSLAGEPQAYLLRVSPELRAFIRILGGGQIELVDVIGEGTLRQFLERYGAGSMAG